MEGRPLDEDDLVERARKGDMRAYGELVSRYQSIAHRTAFLAAGSAADAEDAAQEAFVKAYRALDRFEPGSPFRPWLLRIVTNEARNRRRSARRRTDLALRAASASPSGGAAPSPEAAAVQEETRSQLVKALDRLPEKDRLVISYRYLLGLSEAEMATALSVAPGTVKSRLSRALARLRNELGPDPSVALRGEADA